jgi:hypothetical protein
MKRFRQGKLFRFLLTLITVAIACSGIAIYFGSSGALASSYKTSWIGNSFGGGSKWMQNHIHAMYVAPNGTVFTNSIWDEGGRESGIYKDGDIVSLADDLHGWNRLGGTAVIANNKYLYVAMLQGGVNRKDQDYPPEGTNWYSVRRYNLSGKTAPFSSGRGWDKSMLIVSMKNPVTGLALSGNKLYVGTEAENIVRVYDAEEMKELSSFSVPRPGKMIVDRQGNFWIIQSKKDNNPAKIVRYSPTGKQLPQEITDVVQPTAIALDNQDRLLVAENGQRQQVLIYEIKNKPKQIGTFGVKGGIFAGTPGEVGDLKLYGLTGVGTDAKGNIYVSNNGFNDSGSDLRMFSPSGKLEWNLVALHFVDNSDVDPNTDGGKVFAKQEEFVMDYSKPAGQKWTYKGFSVNPFKYPDDPRLHKVPTSVWFRNIQGKPFLFMTDMYNSFLLVYRFNRKSEGYIAIPAAMFTNTNPNGKATASDVGDKNWPPYQPQKGEWIWTDKNGNGSFDKDEYESFEDYPFLGGWWVDSKGDVWKTVRTKEGIRHFTLQGLNAHGNPMYSYKAMEKIATPKIFTDIRRIEYLPETDIMYISGFTEENPQGEDYGKNFGSEIARYEKWSKNKANPQPRYRMTVPYDPKAEPPKYVASMSTAGDYLFTVQVKTAEVHVHNATTGELLKKFKPGPEVASESGWVDIPYGIRAFRRKNGEYLLFVEEVTKAKVVLYTLPAKIAKQAEVDG